MHLYSPDCDSTCRGYLRTGAFTTSGTSDGNAVRYREIKLDHEQRNTVFNLRTSKLQ